MSIMGSAVDAPLAQHIKGTPIGWYDDDYSSSELGDCTGGAEMMLNMSNKISSLSNCSDELMDASNMMQEPSVCLEEVLGEGTNIYSEPNEGSERLLVVSQPMNNMVQPEPVQMACIQEYHHYPHQQTPIFPIANCSKHTKTIVSHSES